MHLYTHKALLSSCMDEPHDVRGDSGSGRAAVPNTVQQAVAASPQAKARMNDVAPCNDKMYFLKKRSTEVYSGDTPPSGLPLPSGRQHPLQGHHEMCCSKQCTRFLGCHYQSTKFLFLRRNFNKFKETRAHRPTCVHTYRTHTHTCFRVRAAHTHYPHPRMHRAQARSSG